MRIQIRAWLAGLALCLIPNLCHSQHFLNHCVRNPVPAGSSEPSESERPHAGPVASPKTSRSRDWIGVLGLHYCVSPQEHIAIASIKEVPSKNRTAPLAPTEPDEIEAFVAELNRLAAEQSRQQRLEIAEQIRALAKSEPVDVGQASDEPRSQVQTAPQAKLQFQDAPVICSLRSLEEYLPYDLTAGDMLRWDIFAEGIPRLARRIRAPLKDADEPQGDPVADNDLATVEAIADVEAIASVVVPVECLLDDLRWHLAEYTPTLPQDSVASALDWARSSSLRILAAPTQLHAWTVRTAKALPIQPADVPQAAPLQPAEPENPDFVEQFVDAAVADDLPLEPCHPLNHGLDDDTSGAKKATAVASLEVPQPEIDDPNSPPFHLIGSEPPVDTDLAELLEFVRRLTQPVYGRMARGYRDLDSIQR